MDRIDRPCSERSSSRSRGFEWTNLKNHENLWFNTAGTYSANFFTLTGFHGLHVSIGVIFLAITTLYALAGKFTPRIGTRFLTCVSLYWHFVDIVWILLFFVMYVPAVLHPSGGGARSVGRPVMPASPSVEELPRRRAGSNRTLQWAVWSALGVIVLALVAGTGAPAVAGVGTPREHRAGPF